MTLHTHTHTHNSHSLQDYSDPTTPYHISDPTTSAATYHIPPPFPPPLPPAAGTENDYDDIPDSPTELEKRTTSNTNANYAHARNGFYNPVPPPAPPSMIPSSELHRQGNGGMALDGPQSPATSPEVDAGYSKVHKLRSREKDEMENEAVSPPPPLLPTPMIINAPQYVSSSTNALAQEIDRLVTDLENSRAIARQW